MQTQCTCCEVNCPIQWNSLKIVDRLRQPSSQGEAMHPNSVSLDTFPELSPFNSNSVKLFYNSKNIFLYNYPSIHWFILYWVLKYWKSSLSLFPTLYFNFSTPWNDRISLIRNSIWINFYYKLCLLHPLTRSIQFGKLVHWQQLDDHRLS